MSNRWSEDLRRRMERYEVDAPDGLFDDIMNALPEATAPASTMSGEEPDTALQPSSGQPLEPEQPQSAGRIVPLWRHRAAVAAAVAAIVLLGITLWRAPIAEPSLQIQSGELLATDSGIISSSVQPTLEQEELLAEKLPTEILPTEDRASRAPSSGKMVQRQPVEAITADETATQSEPTLQAQPTEQAQQPAQEQSANVNTDVNARADADPATEGETNRTSEQAAKRATQKNQPRQRIYAAQPPQRTIARVRRGASAQSRVAANLFTSGFSGGSRGSMSQQLFSLNSALFGSRVQADGDNTDEMLLPDASRTISRDVHHHQPLRAGVSLRFAVAPRWSVESGLQYAKLVSELSSGSKSRYYDERISLHYIGLPLSAAYNVWESRALTLYVTAGGMVEKCVSGSLRTNYIIDGEQSRRSNADVMVDELQWSISAGVGVQVNLSPTVGLYAEPGVGYWFDNGNDLQTIYHDRPLNFNLNLGLRFTLK